MITNTQKKLYNTYLYATRTSEGKPFNARKDFDKIDDSIILFLTRIENLLNRYPHIDPIDYFNAPYKIYPNADYFTLEYYAGMGAVSAYSSYMKQICEMPPDSDAQIEFIKKSLKFLGSFCFKNKIKLEKYATYKTGITYDWMKHVKKHEISIYVLMEFPEINNIINNVENDERELFLGNIGENYQKYKSKYIKSKLAKELVRQGTEKIKKIINHSEKT
jgi:hypothetical protein